MFSAKAKVCGIIANPVEHSLSPLLHRILSNGMGVDSVYVPFLVENDIETALKGAFALGVHGINITIPYKQAVIPYLSHIDEAAGAIGAVNTLVRDEKSASYIGYNTDMEGLALALWENNISIKGENVIVLGCGGAAKSVIYLCFLHKVKSLTIIGREKQKVYKLLESVNVNFSDTALSVLEFKDVEGSDSIGCLEHKDYIVFQTTPVGMYPKNLDLIISNPHFYEKCRTGIDLVYTPLETSFMKEFIKRGKKAVSGLDMLINQGIFAWEYWNEGKKVDSKTKEKAKAAILEFLEKK